MGSKSSGGERVAWAIGTGGASELYRSGQEGGVGKYFGAGALGYGQSKVEGGLNAPAEEARKQTELLAKQQREMAEKAAADKTAADEALAKEQAKQQAGLDMKSAKQRQARLASGAKGRSDTILTGPLGLTASGPKSGRTLLGS
jgi:hypothetical protein